MLAARAANRTRRPQDLRAEVVQAFPHDVNAYCQGLVIDHGELFEGTGKRGRSTLRRVDLTTGKVQQSVALPPQLFGEGITVWKDQIIQLTWTSNTGIIYDKKNFDELSRFQYEGQGWGLTHDGTNLIMSDGTSTLRFVDPETMKLTRRLPVRSAGRKVNNLNELEFVNGKILANVWTKDYIVRISPDSGAVTGVIDLSGLHPRQLRRDPNDDVLNGIAYDAENDRLFVTGKNWPKVFEIRLIPRAR